MLTKAQAEAEGFTVDTTCYPWFAYKGSRFAPQASRTVLTDLEAELLSLMKLLDQTRRPFKGYDEPMRTRINAVIDKTDR